jgi:glutamyl-tRNA synthetase/glutamyl-Q tRNA(Asp) synthetase
LAPIISRFAPAPTGHLHLGHVANALYVWGITGAQAGRVVLRIEDHDRLRSRPEFDAALVEDLAWLGFVADGPPVRQSDRGDIYVQALAALRRQGLVYACACSRAEIDAANAAPEAGLKPCATQPVDAASVAQAFRPADAELRYPGTCRDRALAEGPGLGLRVRLDPSVERFTDLRHGPLEQTPSDQCGDLLVRDRDGHWTYQFAATVDDYVQGVTLVIRGDDLLASTGRQLQLARLLGRTEPPAFFHHALIMKAGLREPAGRGSLRPGEPLQKLSKSDGDTGVRDLRAQGWSPAQVIGRAAALVGLVEREAPIAAEEVPRLFSYHRQP